MYAIACGIFSYFYSNSLSMKAGDKVRLQQTFGRVVKKIRLEGNISQAELAVRGDFNRTYISDLERGLKEPSLSTIMRLSYAFKILPSELIQQLEGLIEIK